MTPSEIYALVTGSLLVVILTVRLVAATCNFLPVHRVTCQTRRHLFLRYFIHRHRYVSPITCATMLLLLCVTGSVTFVNVFRVNDLHSASRRAATIALINLPFLFLASQLSFAAHIIGVSIAVYRSIHRWLSALIITEIIVHIALMVTKMRITDIRENALVFYGILAGSSVVAIGLLALLRRVAYELTLKLHQALALLLLGSLYGHIPKGSRMARMLLYVTAGLFCTGTVLQLCRIMYRNIPPPSTMRVHKHGGAAIVSIELRRGWKIRAGQYVQLCFPGVTALSGFESHPFMICWWDQRSDQHPLILEVLVAERKARSFTSRFQRLLNDEQGRRGAPTVFVDGPFGVSADLHKYSTVLLVATGIGIAAQLPYTKELVRASSHWAAMTRKVLLVWEVENHDDVDWAKQWVDEILAEDAQNRNQNVRLGACDKLQADGSSIPSTDGSSILSKDGLSIELYNRRDKIHGHNYRLVEKSGKLDVGTVIKRELKERRGRMIVSVSANPDVRDQARSAVFEAKDSAVAFYTTPFQPFETQI